MFFNRKTDNGTRSYRWALVIYLFILGPEGPMIQQISKVVGVG